jgi:hypothetical protein
VAVRNVCGPGAAVVGLHAPEIATTQQFGDGSLRTIVWERGRSHRMTAVIQGAGLHSSGLGAKAGEWMFDPHRSWHDSRRYWGRVLHNDEEILVPCGRRHGGHRDARGIWHDGPKGQVRVSTRLFLERARAAAAS